MAERMYSPIDVAALWGLSPKTVRRMVADGELGHVRIGRLIRIPESAIRTASRPVLSSGDVPKRPRAKEKGTTMSPTDLIRLKYAGN